MLFRSVEPFEFWRKCDIALLTSENEAQPLSLIESQMCGVPAVAENVGSVSEVIMDKETGFLVVGYQERLDAINKLVNNAELRKKFGIVAKYNSNDKFGIQQFITSHEKAYRAAIEFHKR